MSLLCIGCNKTWTKRTHRSHQSQLDVGRPCPGSGDYVRSHPSSIDNAIQAELIRLHSHSHAPPILLPSPPPPAVIAVCPPSVDVAVRRS